MELLIGYSKIFPLEMKGSDLQKKRYTMWGRCKRTCVHNGGGGSNFGHSGTYVLI